MLPKLRRQYQSGQALLLVLLSMAVILTVVMSVSVKSVNDVAVGTYEEDALRAFSAAEAGIEKALLNNQVFTNEPVTSTDTSVRFTSTIANSSPGDDFLYPSKLGQGESATFWFATHDSNGNINCTGPTCYSGNGTLDVCWGDTPASPDVSKRPALVVNVFYDDANPPKYLSGDFSNIKVDKHALDFNNLVHSNNFNSSDVKDTPGYCKMGSKQFLYGNKNGYSFVPGSCGNTPGCVILIKTGIFYNDIPQSVYVKANGFNFPAQGSVIESTGNAGNSSRRLNVFQAFAEPPQIFEYAVYSENDI